jgi:hypothetical protein
MRKYVTGKEMAMSGTSGVYIARAQQGSRLDHPSWLLDQRVPSSKGEPKMRRSQRGGTYASYEAEQAELSCVMGA